MVLARVFPRKTKATPTDDLAFIGLPKGDLSHITAVNVSVTFSWDKPVGEFIAEQWAKTGIPTEIGGAAYGQPAGEFIPGKFLREGYTITSRGCHNKCWFCRVPKTQGQLIELPIRDGWIIQDDNLLLCSDEHIKQVFEMLAKQPERPTFLGGLEAALLKPAHVAMLAAVKPKEIFFAYDTPNDYEPLLQAGAMLREGGFTLRSRKLYAYVLCGYPGDTFAKAEQRMIQTLEAGFIPFAMLWKHESGFQDEEWAKFQRLWCRVAIIVSRNKSYFQKPSI